MKLDFNQSAEVQRIFPTPVYKTNINRQLNLKENKTASEIKIILSKILT